MFGSAEVGTMVCTPEPDIEKFIVSAPALALAAVMASRSEQSESHVPSLVSATFDTVYVVAKTDAAKK